MTGTVCHKLRGDESALEAVATTGQICQIGGGGRELRFQKSTVFNTREIQIVHIFDSTHHTQRKLSFMVRKY